MIAFIVGFIIGYLTTIPIGPINIAVVMKALRNHTAQALLIGVGSAFMDVLYCGAAVFGVGSLVTNPTIDTIFRVSTFAIFFVYGLKTTFGKLPETHFKPSEDDVPGFKRYFLLGVAMYFSNPSFLAYWITIGGIVHGYKVIESTMLNNALFALGTGAGVTVWFFTLVELVERQKMKFEVDRIRKITRFFGLVLLVVSSVLGWNLVKEFVLHR
ncbi:MAG: LysE family transporter [Bacteroidota bacterium]